MTPVSLMEKIKAFISYSHDSEEHRQRVLEFSDQLRDDGVDCWLDQYINGAPPEGWQRRMERQIGAADFVLLVCTPRYLQRFKGEDREGGRGVNFEGVIISQVLYDNFQKNTKFIPLIPDDGSLDDVPLMLKSGNIYKLGSEYEKLYRVLTNQPRFIAKPLGKLKHYPPTDSNPLARPKQTDTAVKIQIDRLPTVAGEFFGRKDELKLLDEAWGGVTCDPPGTRVIQFIASGGTGKTKLLRHWLNRNQQEIGNHIVWSFYSQGSSEDKQVSASPFFTEAFKVLQAGRTTFSSEEEKGGYLAELLHQQHCLLVLDGLEPLQYAGKGMEGRLKDKAIACLLQKLAAYYSSLCIITTRLEVHDISDRPHVQNCLLDNLNPRDGVRLLRSLGVHGSDQEMEKAVREYSCHALALHLLGNALTTYLDRDIHKRDTIGELLDDYDSTARHTFKIMQAYQQWLQNTPELQLLYLLGLFDHPIEIQLLEVLWRAQIPYLTSNIPLKAWKVAIRDLKEKHRMLSAHEGQPEVLDCHPLIREYFGKQLQKHQPEAWQQAHEKLYHYYKALPEKKLPDTLEEMQPLFSAVTHGCKAGLHMQTLLEVLWPRIRRKKQAYVIKTLGAYSDYLAALSHFFEKLWSASVNGLSEVWKVEILNWAGFSLRALGRLPEADAPMQGNVKLAVRLQNWLEAALGSNNFCELKLVTGDIKASIESGRLGLTYVDRTNDYFQRTINRATLGNALHQAMVIDDAIRLFEEAELIQQKHEPEYPHLYSLYGFRYCDLLLDLNRNSEVLERFEEFRKWRQPSDHLLRIASEHLVGGRVYLQMNNWQEAIYWLDIAVSDLRSAGHIWMLPFGLISRASCFRHMRSFSAAKLDLEEVFEIFARSKMRLHLSDYHLESARLWLAEEMVDKARKSIQAATDLIKATGYIRRLSQLKELQRQVAE